MTVTDQNSNTMRGRDMPGEHDVEARVDLVQLASVRG